MALVSEIIARRPTVGEQNADVEGVSGVLLTTRGDRSEPPASWRPVSFYSYTLRMTDATYLELLASYEAALEAVRRRLAVA